MDNVYSVTVYYNKIDSKIMGLFSTRRRALNYSNKYFKHYTYNASTKYWESPSMPNTKIRIVEELIQ